MINDGAPIIFDVADSLKAGRVIFVRSNEDELHSVQISGLQIPIAHYFDLLLPTMNALFEDLTPGSELKEEFLREYENLQDVIGDDGIRPETPYGVYAYYPVTGDLVRYAPMKWHRLALLLRNSTLYADPEIKLNWQEVRNIFERTVIGVAGCSVGNNVSHALIWDLRPLHFKVADVKDYHLANTNRVRLTYRDFGKNKALVTAEQIHATDPFLKVHLYSEGVHQGNVERFMLGDPSSGEPESTIIVEETDHIDTKLLIWESARQFNKPLVMVTDIGASAVQVDIRRFDLNPNLPLAFGVSDEEIYAKKRYWEEDEGDSQRFFDFATALIGDWQWKVPEFKRLVRDEKRRIFGKIPQLGSTAMVAGGFVSKMIAWMLLGYDVPERIFLNLLTGEIVQQGGKFHGK